MFTAEQLIVGSWIILSSYGERAIQPEHEDVYYVDFIEWVDRKTLLLYLIECYSGSIHLVTAKTYEKVEIL